MVSASDTRLSDSHTYCLNINFPVILDWIQEGISFDWNHLKLNPFHSSVGVGKTQFSMPNHNATPAVRFDLTQFEAISHYWGSGKGHSGAGMRKFTWTLAERMADTEGVGSALLVYAQCS